MKTSKQSGFTLIELMVTVAIIGILAAVAVPNYKSYVVRSNRSAAEAQMMDISNRNQQYLLGNRSFATVASTLNYTLPTEISSKYSTPTITVSAYLDSSCVVQADTGTAPSFVITLTPISTGPQANDGAIYLSNTGVKCPANKW